MWSNNVNLRQLRAFTVIADKGSFVAAAEILHLSQPALSQSIRQLEEQIGSPLFHRTTRSVRLTSLGLSFLPHVRHLLQQFEMMMEGVHDIVAKKRGQVTIACLPSVASRLMPRVVAANEKLYPGLKVIIRDTHMRGVVAAVTSGEADLGIGGSVADNVGLDSSIIARDEFHAVMPVTSPLARRRTVRLADLADQPFVAMSHESGVREMLDLATAELDIRLKIIAEVSNIATLTGMVEEGIGVSALPGLVLPRNNHSFVRHRPLVEPQIQRTIRLYWRAGIGLSPSAQAIVASLKRCIAEDEVLSHFPNVRWHAADLDKAMPDAARR